MISKLRFWDSLEGRAVEQGSFFMSWVDEQSRLNHSGWRSNADGPEQSICGLMLSLY
jgi:hypothetical protein